MRIIAAICVLLAWPATAETLVAARTLRAQTIVAPNDFVVASGTIPGTAADPAEVIGLETRVAIYQGRPIRTADLGPPAIIDRNQMVMLNYQAGPLNISAEGRALGRGGIGDRIRVMNIASRTTVTGMVAADGSVWVTADR
ncbi:MAG: flagellar basal body P-ring formation chaperone FlgA [Albidovulum sp.]|uniref:flagellar basal body P-ring formation chaperone FlgA n=1 Tax=Albidovulum sp. TaxID=1872424 RepID=UPI003C9563A3